LGFWGSGFGVLGFRFGVWVLGFGGFGVWVWGLEFGVCSGSGVLGFVCWALGFRGINNAGFGVWSLGFRVWDLGFAVWVLGVGVCGLVFGGFVVWGLWFEVWGLEVLGLGFGLIKCACIYLSLSIILPPGWRPSPKKNDRGSV
jgi:hypothetical protein